MTATLDQLQASIVQLTGALNAHIEIINKMEKRLERLEAKEIHIINNTTPNGPKDENDLREKELAKGAKPVNKPFTVKSAGGDIKISHKITAPIFKKFGNEILVDFFILPGLTSFDGIIGNDTLKKGEAIVDRRQNILTISPGIEIPLKEKISTQVNNIEIRDNHLDEQTKTKLKDEFLSLFGPISDEEFIDTNVRVEKKLDASRIKKYRMVVDRGK